MLNFPKRTSILRSGSEEKKRERRTGAVDFLVAQRNDVVPHESSNIRRFAQIWIPHDIQIRYASQADSLANSVPAGFLNTNQLICVREAHAGK